MKKTIIQVSITMSSATEQQLFSPVTAGSTESIIKPLRLRTITNSVKWLSQLVTRIRSHSSAETPETTEEKIIKEFGQKHPGIFLT
ncbi:MAG: hypothetical protein HGA97_01620 [Chlorobiaceae bacterium]|nr:hypothetical protein [Chlorobiaceae bacterium]